MSRFVRGLAADPDDAAIVRAIIQMAHSLKLKTIADMETEELAQMLQLFRTTRYRALGSRDPCQRINWRTLFATISRPERMVGLGNIRFKFFLRTGSTG